MPELIISIKEARKLLGKDYDRMTDEQLEDLIIQLDEIARLTIRQSIERIRDGRPIIDAMPVKLDDIYYFREKKTGHPAVYNLANEVSYLSQANETDKILFQAKLDKLATVPGDNAEQRRMAADLVCEFQAYKTLHDDGLAPHWVEETSVASQDLKYSKDAVLYPVEVKHINPPRDEDDATSRGESVGGSVSSNYMQGVTRKITANIEAARTKFEVFNGSTDYKGSLYIYISESFEAQVARYFPGSRTMQERVEATARGMAPEGMDIIVQDINSLLT